MSISGQSESKMVCLSNTDSGIRDSEQLAMAPGTPLISLDLSGPLKNSRGGGRALYA